MSLTAKNGIAAQNKLLVTFTAAHTRFPFCWPSGKRSHAADITPSSSGSGGRVSGKRGD